MPPDRTAPLTVALYQPDIPQNTGTILRTCACLGLAAAIIEPAGFLASDKHFRRAGMDYLAHVEIARYPHWVAFEEWRRATGRRLVLLTTKARLAYTAFRYLPGDILLVGRESAGCAGRSPCRRRCASRRSLEAADAVAECRRRRGDGGGRSHAAARRKLLTFHPAFRTIYLETSKFNKLKDPIFITSSVCYKRREREPNRVRMNNE
jgi:tRNA (cytidine/uridine-2'-O-)-methyltransferase